MDWILTASLVTTFITSTIYGESLGSSMANSLTRLREDFTGQLRYILRSLRRRPALAVTAITTLALGLGAVTAMTTIIDAVLLRELPYPRPERLYALSATLPGPDGQPAPYVLSPIEFVRVRAQATTLEQVEAMTTAELALSDGGAPETVRGVLASAGFLRLFGLQPALGREFTEAEDRERARVVILDGGLWARRFGADPSVSGRTLSINGAAHVVIGVTPAGYQPLLQRADVWLPLSAAVDPARPGIRNLLGAARLAPGATPQQAIEELRAIESGVAREFPQSHARAELVFVDLHQALYGSYRPALLLLFGGVTFLLLIACTNVANLAIGRVAERRGEIALRRCIGASTGRILQEQLAESIVLVLFGGLAGSIVALWALPAILTIYPDALPSDVARGISPRVALLVLAQMGAATVLAGLIPAWRACALHGNGALTSVVGARQASSVRDRRIREWLIAVEVAFAVALLSTAGLVGASLQRLNRANTGFDARNVLTLQLAPPTRYPDVAGRAAFVERAVAKVAELPGVVAVGTTQTTWQLAATMQTSLEVEGHVVAPDERLMANIRHITPGYFPAMRVPMLEGRAIDDRDRLGAHPVAVVSASFAQRYWPGQQAVGRRVRRASRNAPWLTVVGVVPEVMDSGVGFTLGPTLYVPYLQQNTGTARVTMVVRTDRDPRAIALEAQRAIWSVDAQQPIDGVRPVEAALAESLAQPRFRGVVLGAFAALGLILACVGVYGVAAYSAAQRRREIGVRLAVGAGERQVVWLLVRQSLAPVAGGLIAGLMLAAGSVRWLESVLYEAKASDSLFATATAALLVCSAIAATWLPARKASRMAPLEVLRIE